MSAALIFSLLLLTQTKAKAVSADEFGPNFAAGSRAFLFMEGTEPASKTTRAFPVPVASSRESFQKNAHLYSVITESRNSVDPLSSPPSAEDVTKAQTELSALEKRREVTRVDSRTPVQVVSSELIVPDTLRNREAQKNLNPNLDPATREKALAELSMRLCRIRFTDGKSKGREAWVWSGYLVDKLPKGGLARSSSSTNTRQKELQATLDKRKALAAKKKALKTAKNEKERTAAQKAYDQALRDLPAQTAAQNQMLQQQALQEEFLMRQQAQAQSGVQIGVPIAPGGGLYP